MSLLKQHYTKIAAFVFLLAAVFIVYFEMHAGSADANEANTRNYIDSVTNQSFRHRIAVGESDPIVAPSGGKTGYPAELCYWTADGHVASEPTFVLLNEVVGKPGPTFCPVCHRLVVPLNPQPMPGATPPPTEAEWVARHSR